MSLRVLMLWLAVLGIGTAILVAADAGRAAHHAFDGVMCGLAFLFIHLDDRRRP